MLISSSTFVYHSRGIKENENMKALYNKITEHKEPGTFQVYSPFALSTHWPYPVPDPY